MSPIEPLMTEHRLIERMIKLMESEIQRMKQNSPPKSAFINTVVDFMKTYADQLHHGKEEDILFRDLAQKKISAEHKKTMDDLVHEHVLGRGNVKRLLEAHDKYLLGEKDSVQEIVKNMEVLVKFYPKHIEKEDRHFFLPVMDYFNEQEKDSMLKEFNNFDRKFIHEKYKGIVSEWEDKKRGPAT